MSLRIKEILTVTCLAAFIFFIGTRENYIDIAPSQIAAGLGAELEGMTELDGSQVRRNFGLNVNDYAGFVYYGHESVMNSEGVLIIKLSGIEQAAGTVSAIEASRDKSRELFKSYAPDQYELLSGSIVEQKGDYVIYVVSERAAQLEQSISDILAGKE